MNARMRVVLWSFLALCVVVVASGPVFAAFITQRDQIAVTIVVNVTPAPVGMTEFGASEGVAARIRREARGSADEVAVTGQVRETVVAQATAQKAVRVEANVSPNPNATLLFSDNPIVSVDATAGTTVVVPCAYHIAVHTTINNWQLKHGLSNDFGSGFGGANVGNNSYLVTPNPTSTPFLVYANDGSVWASLSTNSGIKTYCIDLTIKVPIGVAAGAYSTNAVYTLYW
jgi:hypothetical protein